MDMLSQLEEAVDRLLEDNRTLRKENGRLRKEGEVWEEERRQLVDEVDRILAYIESAGEENS